MNHVDEVVQRVRAVFPTAGGNAWLVHHLADVAGVEVRLLSPDKDRVCRTNIAYSAFSVVTLLEALVRLTEELLRQ